jgi:hypothetical protein
VLTTGVAGLLGGRKVPDAPQGRDWVGYLLGIALVAALVRLSMVAAGHPGASMPSFAWYLLGVGLVAALAYVVTRPGDEVIRRYILLTLFIPVGLVGLWLTVEPNRRVRQVLVVFVLGWTSVAAVDHWRLFERFSSGQVPNPVRELASALEARGISVAEAPYWRAYKLTFMTGERVRVASTDVARITEYQLIAQAAGDSIVRISESPCDGGERIGEWYLCKGMTR